MKNAIREITFRELKQMVCSTKGVSLPTARALKMSNIPIVDKRELCGEAYLTVYKNGFVLYETPDGSTVMRLDACGGYVYYTRIQKVPLTQEDFEDMDWSIRVMIEGEDRLLHNKKSADERYGKIKIQEIDELPYTDNPCSDIAEEIIVRELIESVFLELTDRQKQVFIMYYKYGYKLAEIAGHFHISHQAVSFSLQSAKKKFFEKLKNSVEHVAKGQVQYGYSEEIFYFFLHLDN